MSGQRLRNYSSRPVLRVDKERNTLVIDQQPFASTSSIIKSSRTSSLSTTSESDGFEGRIRRSKDSQEQRIRGGGNANFTGSLIPGQLVTIQHQNHLMGDNTSQFKHTRAQSHNHIISSPQRAPSFTSPRPSHRLRPSIDEHRLLYTRRDGEDARMTVAAIDHQRRGSSSSNGNRPMQSSPLIQQQSSVSGRGRVSVELHQTQCRSVNEAIPASTTLLESPLFDVLQLPSTKTKTPVQPQHQRKQSHHHSKQANVNLFQTKQKVNKKKDWNTEPRSHWSDYSTDIDDETDEAPSPTSREGGGHGIFGWRGFLRTPTSASFPNANSSQQRRPTVSSPQESTRSSYWSDDFVYSQGHSDDEDSQKVHSGEGISRLFPSLRRKNSLLRRPVVPFASSPALSPALIPPALPRSTLYPPSSTKQVPAPLPNSSLPYPGIIPFSSATEIPPPNSKSPPHATLTRSRSRSILRRRD